jgi:hypothetical protein
VSDSAEINNEQDQRREVVRVAREILGGSVGIVAGARRMMNLYFDFAQRRSPMEKDKDILVFVGIYSESDHLPLGDFRRHWNKEALKIKDEELNRFELRVKERAFQACKNLIAKCDQV